MTRLFMAVIILLVGILFFYSTHANAGEWYLAADLLQARFQGPQVDGTWKQERTPSWGDAQAIQQTTQSIAYDVGLGYRFADGESWYAKQWSIEGGYRHWGAISAGGLAVSDAQYHQVTTGQVEPGHYKPSAYDATDRLQGGYLRFAKGVDMGYGLEPYIMAGAFVAYHDLQCWWKGPSGGHGAVGYTGIVAGPTVGGGLKYDLPHGIKARVSVESHWTLTESGHPISSQWLTVGGGLEVPLTFFSSLSGTTRDYLWQR